VVRLLDRGRAGAHWRRLVVPCADLGARRDAQSATSEGTGRPVLGARSVILVGDMLQGHGVE